MEKIELMRSLSSEVPTPIVKYIKVDFPSRFSKQIFQADFQKNGKCSTQPFWAPSD
jgi:hypothetical protein